MLRVKELIALLQEVDPEAPVYFDDNDEGLYSINILVDESFEEQAVYICRGVDVV